MAPSVQLGDNIWKNNGRSSDCEMSDAESRKFCASNADRHQPLAVVGFSLRFPQEATSTESFWSMMMEGRSAMTEYPKSRMNIDSFYCPDASRRDSVRGTLFVCFNQRPPKRFVFA